MNKLRKLSRDQRGFNLIELMIVIAIIGLLIGVGSLAWTAVMRSGNETAAVQSMDNIRKFEAQYAARSKGEFGTFQDLINTVDLDKKFGGTESPVVNGYIFTLTVTKASGNEPPKYEIHADPQGTSGKRHFYTSSDLSTIKGVDDKPATKDDDSI